MTTKKRIMTLAAALLAIMVAIPLFATYANTNRPVNVSINGQVIYFPDQRPVIVDDRVLVPVRGVFEHLGFTVTWVSSSRMARLVNDDTTIIIPTDSVGFIINGEIITPDVPQQIMNNRLMLPLRAVAEAMGATAEWNGANRIAMITTPQATPQPATPTPAPTPTPEPTPTPTPYEPTPTPPATPTPTPYPEITPTPTPYASHVTPTPAPDQLVTSTPIPDWRAPHLATQSQIHIPSDRRFTDAELQAWIDEYWAMGGMSAPERELVRLANIERAHAGLQPLVIDETLAMATRFHAQLVANADFYMNLPLDRIAEVHRFGPYGGSMGTPSLLFGVEGVGGGAGPVTGMRATPQSQMNALMRSEPHRVQLLNPEFTRVGAGAQFSVNEDRVYFYLIYAR